MCQQSSENSAGTPKDQPFPLALTCRLLDQLRVAGMGLPEGRGFATMEGVIGTSDVSARLNVWEWCALVRCCTVVNHVRSPVKSIPH
eukprot:4982157-Amphidinium_carterae.1